MSLTIGIKFQEIKKKISQLRKTILFYHTKLTLNYFLFSYFRFRSSLYFKQMNNQLINAYIVCTS